MATVAWSVGEQFKPQPMCFNTIKFSSLCLDSAADVSDKVESPKESWIKGAFADKKAIKFNHENCVTRNTHEDRKVVEKDDLLKPQVFKI